MKCIVPSSEIHSYARTTTLCVNLQKARQLETAFLGVEVDVSVAVDA